MLMKKQDITNKKNEVLYRKVISLNQGWQDAKSKWNEINTNYKNNFSGGVEMTIDIDLENLIKEIENGDIEKSNNILNELIKIQTFKESNEEKETIIESYFLKCKLYEYLYIAKHNEFLSLFNFFITLVLDYVISYIIIVIYIKTLYKEKCIKAELPPTLIKQIEFILKPQKSLFAAMKDFFKKYFNNFSSKQSGGKNDQLNQSTIKKLDFINRLANLLQKKYNDKYFYTNINNDQSNINNQLNNDKLLESLINQLGVESKLGYQSNKQAGGGFVNTIKNVAETMKEKLSNIINNQNKSENDSLNQKIKKVKQLAFLKSLKQILTTKTTSQV